MKTKTKTQTNHTMLTDEIGMLTVFTVPFAALHYDRDYVRLRDQDRIDDTTDALIELHFTINEN